MLLVITSYIEIVCTLPIANSLSGVLAQRGSSLKIFGPMQKSLPLSNMLMDLLIDLYVIAFACMSSEYLKLNAFQLYYADDHTRVKLKPSSTPGSDYINANYIDVRLWLRFLVFRWIYFIL